MNKSSLATVLGIGVVGILAGIIIFIIPAAALLNFLCIVLGILTLFSGVPMLIRAIMNIKQKGGIFDIVMSALTVAFALALIFSRNFLVMIVCGVYLIALPLVRIVLSDEKKLQFKNELPSLIIGIVMVIAGPGKAVDFLFNIAGIVIIVLSAAYIVYGLIQYYRNKKELGKKTGSRVFADTNGDGNIDTVYVDTTGDGKADTGIKINRDGESK